ncbi:hypothetical protein ABZY42_08280 [Streptomyces sp. NPDC006622]|uniref:hypothetical protein n=1 Tax=Streptomyces sp. NPDC006622 TaxID=3155459 RepID=UPI0033A33EDA
MTTATPGAGAYDRPPYRLPDAPARANGPGAWALDVLLPWRLAQRIYGPFRVFRFSAADAVGLAAPGQPVATVLAEQAADPLIERLLLPRALLGLGALFFVIRLFTGGGLFEPLGQALSDSVLMLATGPVALLLACVPLVAVAHPGTLLTVARLCARPLLTALITTAFCGLFVLWAVHGYDYRPDRTGWLVLAVLFGPWLTVFFGSVLFLIHRNAFGVGGHPLVRPLACVPLVWLTAIAHSLLIDAVEAYPGARPTPAYLVALFAGPVGVTVTAAVEVVLLRRRHGVGFRGPLPHRRPPAPRPPTLPPALVARLRADLTHGLAHHWPRYVDREGVVWALTPAVHEGHRVLWPYVPAFTERTRPAPWPEVEAAAGPLRPR